MKTKTLIRGNRRPQQQRGIALVIAMLALLILTTLAGAVIFSTQTELLTSGNYRLVTQARYAAEAGAQNAMNWLIYTYTPPTTFTSFDMTKYPVQYNSSAVILSAMDGVNGNYPTASVQTAFSSALLNQSLSGSGSSTTTGVTAKLLFMQNVIISGSSTPTAVQTWEITSQGSIAGVRNAQVQLVTRIQRALGSTAYNYGAFTTSAACNSLIIGGNTSTDSYNSNAGIYTATQSNTGGNVASEGNVEVNGASTHLHGAVYSPTSGSGSCIAGATTGLSNNSATIDGGLVHLTQNVPYMVPAAPATAPPTSTYNLNTSCLTISGCSSLLGLAPYTLAPGKLYGNVTLTGATVHLSAGTYTMNSIVLSAHAQIVIDSGPVVLQLAGASLAPTAGVLDFTGGTISNSTGVPANFQIMYAGAQPITISGGSAASFVLDAPTAAVGLHGGSSVFGAIIAGTLDDSGGTALHYDKALSTLYNSVGSYHMTSFTWSKY